MKLTYKVFAWLISAKDKIEDATFTTHESMDSCGWIRIGSGMAEIDVVDGFNPIPMQVEMLKKDLDKMADVYHAKKQEIEQQIQSLLCIENNIKEENHVN
jgi:hypothetical protein